MTASVGDLDLQVQATANRLRLIQIDCADDDAETRQSYLSEVIEQSLRQVMADQRREFLERLSKAFATWQSEYTAVPPPESTRSPADDREWQDPAFLIERLGQLTAQMEPQQRQAVISRLGELGLAPVSRGGDGPLSQEAEGRVRAALKLDDDVEVDASRVAELAGMLAELATALDQVARSTWEKINVSQPRIRPPVRRPLRESMALCAGGDERTPPHAVEPSVEWLRKLIAAMVAGVGAVGFQWGNHYVNTLGPEAVKASASVGMMSNREVCYWRRYQELTRQMDASTINHEVTRMIEQFIAQVMG